MPKLEEGYSLEDHTEGASRQLDAPMLRLDLAKEFDELKQGDAWRVGGHTAKTLVKHADLRVVLIALKAGSSLGEHHTGASLSLQTLEGRVRLKLSTEVVELPRGGLLALGSAIPHDVEALEESLVLLTIAWPVRRDA